MLGAGTMKHGNTGARITMASFFFCILYSDSCILIKIITYLDMA